MSMASMVQSQRPRRATLVWGLGVAAASAGLVALDQVTGPYVRVTMGFGLVVAFTAYYWNWAGAMGLGCLFGLSRLWLVLGAETPWLVLPEVVNVGLNLLLFAVIVAAVRRFARAPALSTAVLPVCGGCGRVRDQAGRWTRFERFVTAVTSARFFHTVCPECEERFGRLLSSEESQASLPRRPSSL